MSIDTQYSDILFKKREVANIMTYVEANRAKCLKLLVKQNRIQARETQKKQKGSEAGLPLLVSKDHWFI